MPKNNTTFFTEPQREIPIIEKPDLLVVGGGPAGIAAALSASRCGIKTLLIERYNHLGGLWTGGLVLPLLATHAVNKTGEKQKVIFGIADDITSRLQTMGIPLTEEDPTIDPEAAKTLFDQMLAESGVQTLFHCWASNVITADHRIQAVIIQTKSGRLAIQPKFVVDATGDGDIFALAGEGYTNLPYHIGLVHRIGNVDKVDPAQVEALGLELGYPTPLPSVRWVNMYGQKDSDGLDIYTLSRITIESRREICAESTGYQTHPRLRAGLSVGYRLANRRACHPRARGHVHPHPGRFIHLHTISGCRWGLRHGAKYHIAMLSSRVLNGRCGKYRCAPSPRAKQPISWLPAVVFPMKKPLPKTRASSALPCLPVMPPARLRLSACSKTHQRSKRMPSKYRRSFWTRTPTWVNHIR